ncbi:MAG: rhomboid family intramembrane serine protease [Gammaproteobacteria bacterium]|nr:rhomboid family intramembrane serine protease [Gammaproteobacteria bacterium]
MRPRRSDAPLSSQHAAAHSGGDEHALAADDARRFKHALRFSLAAVALMWMLFLLMDGTGWSLPWLGVFPRRLDGLFGILTAPLVHGSIGHLVGNTLPVLILTTALLYGYPRAAPLVLVVLYFGSGLAVWLIGRPAWHIGASGVTTGLMFFLFVIGALRWDPRATVLSMIAFFLYGSMVWGVFPSDPEISFESHLSGALLGVLLAVLLRRVDPPLPRKRYSWEEEEDEDPTLHPTSGRVIDQEPDRRWPNTRPLGDTRHDDVRRE